VGSSARVAKENHTIEELKDFVAYRDERIAKATPGTREHTEAVHTRNHYARRLEAAQENEARRKRDDARDPRDIARETVDRLLGY
jgi:hypothetical protein